MVLVTLSIEIVYESKKCLVKSGKDIGGKAEKTKQGYFAKYRWILCDLSLDTLPSIQGYFFEPNFCSAQHDKRKKRGMFLSFLVLSR